jgi:hypothetical protein
LRLPFSIPLNIKLTINYIINNLIALLPMIELEAKRKKYAKISEKVLKLKYLEKK